MKKFTAFAKKTGFLCGIIGIALGLFTAENHTYRAYALEEEAALKVEEARGALQELLKEHDVMALVYLSEEYPLRAEPNDEAQAVVHVPSGQTVEIKDVYADEDGQVWEYVTLIHRDTEYEGYIPRSFLACSNQAFLEWEAAYNMNPSAGAVVYDGSAEGRSLDIEQFPASYQPALQALKQKHPNWTFVPMNTGLNWDTVIAEQLKGGKSLVEKTVPDYMKAGAYDQGNWFYATKEAVELYVDPRNSLTEDAVFQFEQLTYNKTYHTEAAIESFLSTTFMNSSQKAPGTVMTYAHIFWTIGAEEGREVSPFHLAARVLQEQGLGTSPLISGKYPGYEGFYNHFNIKASGKTETEIIVNGLKYARDNGWNNAYFSILGGADVISANYIKRGQDTLYLQKFNVSSNNTHNHQYMQNIAAPTGEAKKIKNLYAGAGSLDNTFVFKIPVFQNMPAAPSPMPTSSTDVVLKLPAGYTDPAIYLDGVAYTAREANGYHIVKAPNGAAKSAVAYRYNASGTPIGMYVWELQFVNNAYKVTPRPGLADLLSYHGFSVRVTGKSGIRFKTGISTSTRAALLGGGIEGYKLKEYGTLVMSNANRDTYPMIKGGQKVQSGMAYGMGANGALQDAVFETAEGRYRFTSVLVGLPVEQYKTEFAFRGYAVLEKDGAETVVYGPVMAKSIYSLAKQLVDMGIYENGSAADVFLRKIISDADAIK